VSFQSLFTDEPQKQWVSGLGYDGGSWRIKPTSFLEDDADQRFPVFQKAWRDGATNDQMFGDEPFKLQGSVGGSGVDNHRPDVAKVESFLTDAGYYKPLTADGPSGYHNGDLDEAIRSFQQANGLAVDGVLKPDGPTISALAKQLADDGVPTQTPSISAPTNDAPEPAPQSPAGSENTGHSSTQVAYWDQRDLVKPNGNLLEGGGGLGLGGTAGAAALGGLLGGGRGGRGGGPETSPPQDQAAPPPQPALMSPALDHPIPDDDLRKELSQALENSRGDATTQKGNDIVVDECTKVIKAEFPELGDHLEHVGGATENGLREEKIAEEVIKGPGDKWLGGSRPDVTLQFGDEKNERYRINTATMRGERMTSREQASFDNLKRNLGNDLASWVPKLRPGMDEDEYRARVRDACRDVAGRWSDHLGKQGKLPAKGRAPQDME